MSCPGARPDGARPRRRRRLAVYAAAATGTLAAWTAVASPPSPASRGGMPVGVAETLSFGSPAPTGAATPASPSAGTGPPGGVGPIGPTDPSGPTAPASTISPFSESGQIGPPSPVGPVGADGTHPCTADDALAGAHNRHAGRTLAEVRAALGASGRLRVIGQDGRCLPLTRDYMPSRTNVYLEGGVVVSSSTG